jgi:zinc transport system substrate-binding protein
MLRFLRQFAAILFALVFAALPARAEGINAVASIAPVHSLLAGVMKGVIDPGLLVTGGRSPHDYVMKPSSARMLHGARVVFWIGPGLEGFLKKPLAGLAPGTRVVGLAAEQGVGEGADPHIWLDPRGAAKMVRAMVRALSGADADNAARYKLNADKVLAGLIALDRELYQALKPIAVVPYLVFHDAYRTFEKRFDLASQGAVALHPGRPPGAKRIKALRRMIVDEKIVCLFTEPQFTPALVKTLTEGTTMRTGVLDPLGAALEPGPGLYRELMRRMARSLLECLGANS